MPSKKSSKIKFLKETNKIILDIDDLKIQGASNVAFACQDAIVKELQKYKKETDKLKDYFFALCKALWKTRPTEPAMKHFLTSFYLKVETIRKNVPLNLAKKRLIGFVKKYKISQKKAIDNVATQATRIPIKRKAVIFTHCHSSIVEYVIKHLHKLGRVEVVVNTETRPLFQGRITANHLAKAGIKVHHIVDSGAYAYAKLLKQRGKEILFFTGADVITRKGKLINKIGTSQISLCLNSLGIPHYVFTISQKIDPVFKGWDLEDVELRDPNEIWKHHQKNLFIHNYAFDITQKHLIKKIVTEKGLLESKNLLKHNKLTKKELEVWNRFDS